MSKNNMPMPQASKEAAVVAQPEVQSAKVSGIEVEALRDGFYDCRRIKAGEVFMISNMNALGSWMKCTDPATEAKHQKMMKDKKDKARSEK